MEGSGSGITEVSLSFCHKEPRKFKENLVPDNRYSSRDSNQTLPKYRSCYISVLSSAEGCTARQHDVTSKRRVIFTVTAMITSKLTILMTQRCLFETNTAMPVS
jgi:hypothetical protein